MINGVLDSGQVYSACSICLGGCPKRNSELYKQVAEFKQVCKECKGDLGVILTEEVSLKALKHTL